jgi:hypothetical protein
VAHVGGLTGKRYAAVLFGGVTAGLVAVEFL